MKTIKIFAVMVFLLIGVSVNAQGLFKGFLDPVTMDELQVRATKTPNFIVLARPAVGLEAFQLMKNKETKLWETSAFSSMGVGLGIQHFKQVNNEAYNDFGANVLVLFDIKPLETTNTAISVAATIDILQYINFGVGYNFGVKNYFFLTGITYSFN